MASLIICKSVHHNNTMKLAQAMAEVLACDIIEPAEVNDDILNEHDLIGIGSGIYNGAHHPTILKMIERIGDHPQKRAFVFSTSTICLKRMHETILSALNNKGFKIIGEFQCRGFMTYSFTKYLLGGLNKGKPNERDLEKAKNFANEMLTKIKTK